MRAFYQILCMLFVLCCLFAAAPASLEAAGSGAMGASLMFPFLFSAFLLAFILFLLKDIHSRKKTERRLRHSEKAYRSIFENATEGIFQSTPDGLFLDVNPAMARMLGYASPEDVLHSLRDISQQVYAHSSDREELLKLLSRQEAISGWEVLLRRKDGSLFWGALNIRRVEDPHGRIPVYFEGTLNDITRHKEDEKALLQKERELSRYRDYLEEQVEKRTQELRRSEQRLQTLFEASADAVLTIKEGVFTDCNQATVHLLGLKDKSEILNTSPTSWAPERQPDGRLSADKQLEMLELAREKGTHRFEWTRLRADGTILPLEVQLTAIYDQQGEPMFNAAWRDLTERKQAEAEIARTNEFMQDVLDAATQVSVIATDPQGTITLFNAGAERMLGYTAREMVGQCTPEAIHCQSEIEERSRRLSREYGEDISGFEVFVAPSRHGGYDEEEWTYVCKDGTAITVNLAVSAIFDQSGDIKMMVGVAMDITGKKRFEKELMEMEKLKSVGTLAGGIAHDFNNLLTGIFGNISRAKDKLEEDHPAELSLKNAEKAMNRASQLTSKLLTFSTGGQPIKDRVSLREVVQIVGFDLSGSNVMPVFDFEEGLWNANVDKIQIEQVFSHLITNAEQAMPGGGVLYISLQNVEVFGEEILGLSPGKYIKAEVRDEGSGIDPQNVNRIFDPYFTTWNGGHGLGLATVHSIISRHGGSISVDTQVGKGSVFTFYLPASETGREKTEEEAVSPGEKRLPRRVLVMDDEEMIRDFTQEILQEEDYEVRTAANGEETLVLYESYLQAGTPFDAVIMDLTIPGGMGGKETVQRILEIDPRARCIVCSGYASDPVLANYRDYGFMGMLTKPHTAEELKKTLLRVARGA